LQILNSKQQIILSWVQMYNLSDRRTWKKILIWYFEYISIFHRKKKHKMLKMMLILKIKKPISLIIKIYSKFWWQNNIMESLSITFYNTLMSKNFGISINFNSKLWMTCCLSKKIRIHQVVEFEFDYILDFFGVLK
jgi:hypothetical protein